MSVWEDVGRNVLTAVISIFCVVTIITVVMILIIYFLGKKLEGNVLLDFLGA